MVKVIASVLELLALVTVAGVKITVSSFSSELSSIIFISKDAEV